MTPDLMAQGAERLEAYRSSFANGDSVLVLDLVTGETIGRAEAQSSPDGVTWSPIGR